MSDRSCFLPRTKIQFAVDSTSLGALKQCPRFYELTILEGWSTKAESIHLRFGIEYHKALQDYDMSRALGVKHNDAVHDVVRALLLRVADWEPAPEDGRRSEEVKTKDTLLRTVIWYLDQFKDDPAKTLIMEDGRPAVELSFRFELDFGPTDDGRNFKEIHIQDASGQSDVDYEIAQPYLLCGHLDRVVDFNGDLFVMDRKTATATIGPYYFQQFEPNNQMTLYTLASQVIMKSPIKGVIIDAAQIADGFSRFGRGMTYRTKEQIDEWLVNLRVLLTQAEQYAIDDYWPQNDTACGMYGGCKYRGVCSKSPQVRAQWLKADFVQKPEEERWNPLIPRE